MPNLDVTHGIACIIGITINRQSIYMNPKKHLFFRKLQISFIYFVKILSADGHTQLNVKVFSGRSARELTTAVVETTHTAQEANTKGYESNTPFNET